MVVRAISDVIRQSIAHSNATKIPRGGGETVDSDGRNAGYETGAWLSAKCSGRWSPCATLGVALRCAARHTSLRQYGLAFAAGITPVGVSSYSDYPPEAPKNKWVSTAGNESGTHCGAEAEIWSSRRGGNAERRG